MSLSKESNVLRGILSSIYFPVQFLIGVAFVGEIANKHDKQHDSKGPDVSRFSSILQLLYDFGCHVAGCPAKDLNLPQDNDYLSVFLNTGAESKVDEFRFHIFIHDDVLQLDIPMGNVLCVQVFQSARQLPDDVFAHGLRELVVRLLLEAVREGNSWEVLHDDVQMVIRFDYVINLHDVRMVQYLQDLYLSPNRAFANCLLYLAFFVGFDGDLFVLGAEDSHSHRGIGALSDDLADDVISLELGSQVALIKRHADVFLIFDVAVGDACKQFIKVVIQSQKLGVSKVTFGPAKDAFFVGGHFIDFCFDFLFFFGPVEELVQILFGHKILWLDVGLHVSGSGFVELYRLLLPGLVEVDLLQGMHQLRDRRVLFVTSVTITACLHNEYIYILQIAPRSTRFTRLSTTRAPSTQSPQQPF